MRLSDINDFEKENKRRTIKYKFEYGEKNKNRCSEGILYNFDLLDVNIAKIAFFGPTLLRTRSNLHKLT